MSAHCCFQNQRWNRAHWVVCLRSWSLAPPLPESGRRHTGWQHLSEPPAPSPAACTQTDCLDQTKNTACTSAIQTRTCSTCPLAASDPPKLCRIASTAIRCAWQAYSTHGDQKYPAAWDAPLISLDLYLLSHPACLGSRVDDISLFLFFCAVRSDAYRGTALASGRAEIIGSDVPCQGCGADALIVALTDPTHKRIT